MPDSLLRQLSDALVVLSQGIAGIGATGKNMQAWYEVENIPAAFLDIADDTKEIGPTRSKSGVANFFFHCITDGTDSMMDLYRDIETAVDADPSLGGLAMIARVTGMSKLVTSETIANGRSVSDIFITVDYRHVRGTP